MSEMRNPPYRSTSFKLRSFDHAVYNDYQELAKRWDWAEPPASRRGIWLYADGVMVLGVGLFTSDAYIQAEDLLTNPDVPLRVRREAIVLAARHFMTYAILDNRIPRMTVGPPSLRRLLERTGFKVQPALPMYGHPLEATMTRRVRLPEAASPDEPPAAPKPKKRARKARSRARARTK
jgi:hypothetical protein